DDLDVIDARIGRHRSVPGMKRHPLGRAAPGDPERELHEAVDRKRAFGIGQPRLAALRDENRVCVASDHRSAVNATSARKARKARETGLISGRFAQASVSRPYLYCPSCAGALTPSAD